MDPSRGADSRYNMNYSMSGIGLSLVDQADMYGNPAAVAALGGRQPSGCLIQPMSSVGVGLGSRGGSLMPNTSQCSTLVNPNSNTSVSGNNSSHQRGIKRAGSDCYEESQNRNSNIGMSNQSLQGLDSCNSGGNGQNAGHQQHQSSSNISEVDESFVSLQNKKSPPANGKKTKGRVKIKMEYIDNKLRRYTTFSKRKTGIMKKAYELSTLTGTQVMLLVASETGHVYTFATRKLQPMITSEAGKQLIQTCLNSPDPPSVGGGDQRMSATGFEETELSYNITDEDSKEDSIFSENESDDSSDNGSPGQSMISSNQDNLILSQSTSLETDMESKNELKKYEATSSTLNQNIINQEKSKIFEKDSSKNLLLTSGPFANLPQEILLELIQSGHLQLHAEEDGSGHQYVAIPIKSTTASPFKLNKTTFSSNTLSIEKSSNGTKNYTKTCSSDNITKQEKS